MSKRKTLTEGKIRLIIAIVFVVILVVTGVISYTGTYGLSKDEHTQWATAITEYDRLKTQIDESLQNVSDACIEYAKKEDWNIYSATEVTSICQTQHIKSLREKVLNNLSELDSFIAKFPDKYLPVIEHLVNLCRTYYVNYLDLYQTFPLLEIDDDPPGATEQRRDIGEEIDRLESKYLRNKYLNPSDIEFTEIDLDYAPISFSYGENYITSTATSADISQAKAEANSYCSTLREKQPSISAINFINECDNNGIFYDFDCVVVYSDGSTRVGSISVMKLSEGMKATGLSFYD